MGIDEDDISPPDAFMQFTEGFYFDKVMALLREKLNIQVAS